MAEAVDAADEKRGLAMLVLHVGFNTAPDQKLDNVLFFASAGHMQWCRQLSIDQVWLGSSSLKQEHEHVGMAQLRSLMQHGLTITIVHVLFLYLGLIEETHCSDLIIVFNGFPEGLMKAPAIFFEISPVFIVDACLFFASRFLQFSLHGGTHMVGLSIFVDKHH